MYVAVTGNMAQQGGLAGTGCADQGNHFALRNLDGDGLQSLVRTERL